MLGALTIMVGGVVVAVIAAVALLGWGGVVPRVQRVGLLMLGSGLLWAAPYRFLGYPSGLGDLLFLCGLAVYVVHAYRRQLWRSVDRLDGREDGRLGRRR